WDRLAARFRAAVKETVKGGNPATRSALASLLGDLPDKANDQGQVVGFALERVLKGMETDLLKLADTEDAGQGVAAARMLGKLAPNWQVALPALGNLIPNTKRH